MAMFHLMAPFKKWLGRDYMDKKSKAFLNTVSAFTFSDYIRSNNICTQMFVIDTDRRATLEDAMNHPWWGKP